MFYILGLHIFGVLENRVGANKGMDGTGVLLSACIHEWGLSKTPTPTPPPASLTNQWHVQTQLWARAKFSTDLLSHGVRWGGINEALGNGTERSLRKEAT